MNWTEGTLSRHSRGRGHDKNRAREQEHWGRVRLSDTVGTHETNKRQRDPGDHAHVRKRGGGIRKAHRHKNTPKQHYAPSMRSIPPSYQIPPSSVRPSISTSGRATYQAGEPGRQLNEDEFEHLRRQMLQVPNWTGTTVSSSYCRPSGNVFTGKSWAPASDPAALASVPGLAAMNAVSAPLASVANLTAMFASQPPQPIPVPMIPDQVATVQPIPALAPALAPADLDPHLEWGHNFMASLSQLLSSEDSSSSPCANSGYAGASSTSNAAWITQSLNTFGGFVSHDAKSSTEMASQTHTLWSKATNPTISSLSVGKSSSTDQSSARNHPTSSEDPSYCEGSNPSADPPSGLEFTPSSNSNSGDLTSLEGSSLYRQSSVALVHPRPYRPDSAARVLAGFDLVGKPNSVHDVDLGLYDPDMLSSIPVSDGLDNYLELDPVTGDFSMFSGLEEHGLAAKTPGSPNHEMIGANEWYDFLQ